MILAVLDIALRMAFIAMLLILGAGAIGLSLYLRELMRVAREHVEAQRDDEERDPVHDLRDFYHYMVGLFGLNPKVVFTPAANEAGVSIGVGCWHCAAVNAVDKGLFGAVCGKCKYPLLSPVEDDGDRARVN